MPTPAPEPGRQTFVTEGGIETYMQYKMGHEFRRFCLFDLMSDTRAMADLRAYHVNLIQVALEHKVGAVLDGVHYRTSRDWGDLLGYSREALRDIVVEGIEFYKELALEFETADSPMPVSGVVGPRGDAYDIGRVMDADEAEDYHSEQIATMKSAGADFVTALTFSQVPEAIGVTRAARAEGIPVAISFTLGKDGRLKTGAALGEAIETVDRETGNGPLYYMVNCTHPVDFAPAFEAPGAWMNRVLRPARQCVLARPRHALPARPTRRRQPGGARPTDGRHGAALPPYQCLGRMLRHRPCPYRRDRQGGGAGAHRRDGGIEQNSAKQVHHGTHTGGSAGPRRAGQGPDQERADRPALACSATANGTGSSLTTARPPSRALAEKGLIEGDGRDFRLTDAGGPLARAYHRERPDLYHYYYRKFYPAAYASTAHSRFCEWVFGADLCQDGQADMAALGHLLEALDLKAGDRVLDLGCGGGRHRHIHCG